MVALPYDRLPNCRPIRSVTAAFHQIALRDAALREEINSWRGNFAFFIISGPPDGCLRQHARAEVAGPISGYFRIEDDALSGDWRYLLYARNEGRGGLHSEALCYRRLRYYFRLAVIQITYVFTEREPCHEGINGGCMRLLAQVLGHFGRYGVWTPVRFLAYYPNKPERRTASVLNRTTPREELKRRGAEGAGTVRKMRKLA